MRLLGLLGILILGMPVWGYRFLCNSITAEGMVDTDHCGACNDENATRWPNHSVHFSVNTSSLPSGISANDWRSLIQDVFNVWSKTPNVLLTATYDGEGGRSFGEDSSHQDLFWVTDPVEWKRLTGVGYHGVLGVTIPPYACPGHGSDSSTSSYRQILDADMILNGIHDAGFNSWALTCPMLSDDCQSIRATVQHETGHFLGLGHPCTSCENLMSAQAEYLVESPQFDDRKGLRALYPDGETTLSGLGSECTVSSDCQSGLRCYQQDTNYYCSKSCVESTNCGNGMKCAQQMCQFPSETDLGAVGLNSECGPKPCSAGLTCVGIQEIGKRFCFSDCTESQRCSNSTDMCHQLKNAQKVPINYFACIQLVGQGRPCGVLDGTPVVCQKDLGLSCVDGVCEDNMSGANVGNYISDGAGSNGGKTPFSCRTAPFEQSEWILLFCLGIWIHRLRKKC